MRRGFWIVAIALIGIALALGDAAAQTRGTVSRGSAPGQEKRVALVIGISSYKNIPTLDNPKNDARLMADTLRSLGFTLVGNGAQIDLDKSGLDRAVQSFGDLLQGADVGLFYYAGHGLQVRGTNYLVPTSANPQRETDVDFQMIDANLVLRQMEGAGTRLNLIILDACRNNPFGVRGLRAAGGGLAQMHAPEGTLISYATQPGNVAVDGSGSNSPYTKALAQTMRQPGLDIFRLFNEVGLQVKRETGGAQQPWVSSSPIDGDFYFAGAAAVTIANAPTPAPSPALNLAAVELAFWETIKGSTDTADFREYVSQYPNGRFVGLARNRINALTHPNSSQMHEQVAIVPPRPAPSLSEPTAGQAFRDCSDCPEMVMIAPGNFMMGSDASETTREQVEDHIANRERPRHAVSVRTAFSVGKFHITRGEYARFVQATGHTGGAGCNLFTGSKFDQDANKSWRDPGFPQTERDPVVCVSWGDAKAYAKWLEQKTGKGYRLLTEAEWEYAARAGTSTARYWGDNPDALCNYANGADLTAKDKFPNWNVAQCRDGYVYTSPVGNFQPNGFGLYDMLGNALQWTEDCFEENYAGAPNDASIALVSGGDCKERVPRGGFWGIPLRYLRSASRSGINASNRISVVGFRVARTN